MQEKIVDVQVGKQGLTEETVLHIRSLLKQKKEVRVKFLKSSMKEGRKQLAEEIEKKVKKGKLIGNTYRLTP